MKLDKTLIITSSLYSRKMLSKFKAFGIIMVNHLLMSGKGLVWNCLEIKGKRKTNEVRSLMHLVIFPVV